MKVVLAANFPRDEKLGTSRVPLRLAHELGKLGVDVSLVFHDDLRDVPAGRADQLTAPFRMAETLARRARAADVVEIAGFDAWAYARFARRFRRGQAVVSRSNGLWFKAVAADVKPKASASRALASQLYQRHVLNRWEQSSISSSHVALFPSRLDGDEVVRLGWQPPEGVAVVHHGVDEFFASAVPLEQRRDVAFVGTFFERKGSDIVGQAMSRVLRARPALAFTLFGTGVPAPAVLGAFDPEVRARVTVVQALPPDELARRLGTFAVLFFPTRYEGFGIVVIEAMRAGLAVVTTPTGAGADLIRDGDNGLLVPIGSVAAAEAAVGRVVDDPALRIRLARAAAADARELTWARAAREVAAVYARAKSLAARRST